MPPKIKCYREDKSDSKELVNDLQNCLQELSLLNPQGSEKNDLEYFLISLQQRSQILNLLSRSITALWNLEAEDEDLCVYDNDSTDLKDKTCYKTIEVDVKNENLPLVRTSKRKKNPSKKGKQNCFWEDHDNELLNQCSPQVSHKKRNNLKDLIRKICDLAITRSSVPADYAIFNGETYQSFGLTRAYTQELCILLELCPAFRQKNNLFYSGLFQASPKVWVLRLRYCRKWIESGYGQDYLHKYHISRQSPILKEIAEDGFESFNPFTAEEIQKYIQNTIKIENESLFGNQVADVQEDNDIPKKKIKPSIFDASSVERPYLGKGGYEIPLLHNVHNTNSDLLSYILPGPIEIHCSKQSYLAHDVYHHKMALIPDLVVSKVFALVALIIKDGKVEGKVILQPKCVDSDLSKQMKNLFSVLNKAWCITGEDFFKVSYVLPPGKDEKKYKKSLTKKEYKEMQKIGDAEVEKQMTETDAQIRNYFPSHFHEPVRDLEASKSYFIEFKEEIDLSKVNNLSFLLGDTKDSMTIRSLMNEDSFQKFKKSTPFGNKNRQTTIMSSSNNTNTQALCGNSSTKKYDQKYSMNQLTRTFFELFRMFSGLDMRQFITHIPFYGKQHEFLRNLVSKKESMANFLDKITKQCPHCGKIFHVNKTSIENSIILDHIKFCRLERSNCECGLTYRTAREKRRHMLLFHSGIKYYECSQCNYVNKSQKFLDHHFEYFHGYPGREEVCDLCFKTFKCKNHLQVHRFNHENYWCSTCHVEILGRVIYRNHMKKLHAAGYICDLCSKVCFTKGELSRHQKLGHADTMILNS